MAARRASRKEQIAEAFGAFCDAVGGALGAAEGRRDAAVQVHAEAMVEAWLRAEGLEAARADPGLRPLLTNPRLTGPLGRIEADRRAAFNPWLATGPSRLAALLAAEAPGLAGGWPAEPVDPVGQVAADGPVPGLWYVGAGRIGDRPTPGFPVGIPLLDESHLQVHATPDGRDAAEAWLQDLLLRVVGYFRPGLVQLHLWDVGSFTGTLPGLYPLTRNGLLTVHDPTRLPQLLAELSDRIRRVHTRVLADGHPSLRALAEHGEPRSEQWVIAVLVGNRSALREDDHRQLQRVARGGPACGVQLVLLDVPASLPAAVETVQVADDGTAHTTMTGQHVRVELARFGWRRVRKQTLPPQLPHHQVDQVGADVVTLFNVAYQQQAVEDHIELAWYAARLLIHAREHVLGNARVVHPADRAQPMLDVAAGLAGAERAQVAARDHALLDLLQRPLGQGFAELGLAQEECLDERRLLEAVIREHAQLLQRGGRQVVHLVHDDHGAKSPPARSR